MTNEIGDEAPPQRESAQTEPAGEAPGVPEGEFRIAFGILGVPMVAQMLPAIVVARIDQDESRHAAEPLVHPPAAEDRVMGRLVLCRVEPVDEHAVYGKQGHAPPASPGQPQSGPGTGDRREVACQLETARHVGFLHESAQQVGVDPRPARCGKVLVQGCLPVLCPVAGIIVPQWRHEGEVSAGARRGARRTGRPQRASARTPGRPRGRPAPARN